MNKYFKINSANISYRIIDEEAVVLNLKTGDYYLLEGTSAFIWKQLEKKISLKDLTERVNNEYAMDKRIVARDLKSLIKDLSNENLILAD